MYDYALLYIILHFLTWKCTLQNHYYSHFISSFMVDLTLWAFLFVEGLVRLSGLEKNGQRLEWKLILEVKCHCLRIWRLFLDYGRLLGFIWRGCIKSKHEASSFQLSISLCFSSCQHCEMSIQGVLYMLLKEINNVGGKHHEEWHDLLKVSWLTMGLIYLLDIPVRHTEWSGILPIPCQKLLGR